MRTCITILGIVALAWPAAAIDIGAAWDALWEESPAQTHKNQATDQETAEPHMGTGVYRVTGRGAVPPDAKSEAQGRLLAVGAAQLDALRKLATLLEGADISSASTADQYVQTGYTVEETAQARLKGVRVLETRFAEEGIAEVDVELVLAKAGQEPDFSSLDGYQIRRSDTVVTHRPEEPVVEAPQEPATPAAAEDNAQGAPEEVSEPQAPEESPVVVEEDLNQEELYQKSLETLFDVWSSTLSGDPAEAQPEAEAEPALPEKEEVAMADVSAEARPAEAPEQAEKTPEVIVGEAKVEIPIDDRKYTDLVIDVRGYGLVPSTTPRAITPKGEQIFPFSGGIMEKFTPEKEPEVRFLKNIEEAAALPGYGGNPLIIKADGVQLPDRTDVVIDKMKLIELLPLRNSRVAKGNGYVILLVD